MIKLGLVGDPISHSLSPIIHSTVMKNLNKPFSYELYNIKKGNLELFISKVKEENITGFNVTMPHKVDIIEFLDELDNESLTYNSVNTVKYENGKLYGYNTDADGFIMSFENESISLKDKNILILGAGGVTNTIAVKIAKYIPEKIVILNRNISKAQDVCTIVKNNINVDIKSDNFDTETIANYAQYANVLINTTPLGMHGVSEDFKDITFLENLNRSAIVYDLIYNPRQTKLLKHASKLGLKTMNGLEMLINQAIIADQIYLKEFIDIKRLNKFVKQNL